MNKLSAKYIEIDGLSLNSRIKNMEQDIKNLEDDFIEILLVEGDAVAVSKPIDVESYLESSYKL